jgi:dolichyl-phosphate beta-glucosyltransferase
LKKNLFLSIVIPAYNEEGRIGRTIEQIENYFKSRKIKGEIIVVNDGSQDKTKKIVKEKIKKIKNLKLVNLNPNRGKGAAVKVGMLEGKGEIIAFTDADLSTPIFEMDKLIKRINNRDFQIAIGSRGLPGSKVEIRQSFFREQLGRIYGILTRLLVLRGIPDTQCGFKAFKKEVAKKLFDNPITPSPIWDIEILILATLKGCKIAQVPVIWRHDPVSRITYNLTKALKVFLELLKLKQKYKIWLPLKVQK